MTHSFPERKKALSNRALVLVAISTVCVVSGCAPRRPACSASNSVTPSATVGAAVPKPAIVTNLQQAFNLGIAHVNSGGFSVDKWKCKVTIQKSKNGWLMTVTSIPPTIGGEQIILIKPDGDVIVGFGL